LVSAPPRRKARWRALPAYLFAALALMASGAVGAETEPQAAVARGRYLLHAAGCITCHTDEKGGAFLAGGRALVTPFGTFYSPNITADPINGIGAWTEADFLGALGRGRAPDGRPYYPAFPYTAYNGMTEADMKDLWAFLATVPPAPRENRPHELDFPYSLRPLNGVWQWLYLEARRFVPDPARDAAWNRGAYLVRHLAHCAACHSPRGWLGAVDADREFAGNPQGPDGKKVPNVTPHEKDGIGAWSKTDLTFFFKTGFLPDGDVVGGAMEDVIRETTSKLTDGDRAAIAAYLKSLPALSNR
jgi:mono/diheme cytochrome c family protein